MTSLLLEQGLLAPFCGAGVFGLVELSRSPHEPSKPTGTRIREGITHIHECSCIFMRRRDAWASTKRSFVTSRLNVQGGGREHNHKYSYVFKMRKGAWARPKHSLVAKRPNVQRRHKAHTRMLVCLYDEERCMGTPNDEDDECRKRRAPSIDHRA